MPHVAVSGTDPIGAGGTESVAEVGHLAGDAVLVVRIDTEQVAAVAPQAEVEVASVAESAN